MRTILAREKLDRSLTDSQLLSSGIESGAASEELGLEATDDLAAARGRARG